MITRVDQRLRREAGSLGLRFTCEHCAHFAAERAECANGYPTEAHRAIDLEAALQIEFCKEFELA